MLSQLRSHDNAMAAHPKWRKIVYEHQGYPDYHVNDSFHEELKKKGEVILVFDVLILRDLFI